MAGAKMELVCTFGPIANEDDDDDCYVYDEEYDVDGGGDVGDDYGGVAVDHLLVNRKNKANVRVDVHIRGHGSVGCRQECLWMEARFEDSPLTLVECTTRIADNKSSVGCH